MRPHAAMSWLPATAASIRGRARGRCTLFGAAPYPTSPRAHPCSRRSASAMSASTVSKRVDVAVVVIGDEAVAQHQNSVGRSARRGAVIEHAVLNRRLPRFVAAVRVPAMSIAPSSITTRAGERASFWSRFGDRDAQHGAVGRREYAAASARRTSRSFVSTSSARLEQLHDVHDQLALVVDNGSSSAQLHRERVRVTGHVRRTRWNATCGALLVPRRQCRSFHTLARAASHTDRGERGLRTGVCRCSPPLHANPPATRRTPPAHRSAPARRCRARRASGHAAASATRRKCWSRHDDAAERELRQTRRSRRPERGDRRSKLPAPSAPRRRRRPRPAARAAEDAPSWTVHDRLVPAAATRQNHQSGRVASDARPTHSLLPGARSNGCRACRASSTGNGGCAGSPSPARERAT